MTNTIIASCTSINEPIFGFIEIISESIVSGNTLLLPSNRLTIESKILRSPNTQAEKVSELVFSIVTENSEIDELETVGIPVILVVYH